LGPTTSPATSPSSDDPATGGADPNGETPPADAQDLAAARLQIAGLSAEVEASDQMIARLRDELHLARQALEATRGTGSGGAEADSASSGQDSGLAVAVTTARVVELQRELEAARQQIADLSAAASKAEAEAANLRDELAAREDLASTARANDAGRPQEAETVEVITVIEEVLTSAEIAPQSSAAESSTVPSPTAEAAAVRDTVSPDDLLLEPGRHFGRQVVVTGPVVWLLRRYWLQSDTANRSLLIDVDGLQSEVRDRLKESVEKIDYLAQAKARITGTIERQGSKAYRLAASELVLVE
jgi:cell division protein FtsB